METESGNNQQKMLNASSEEVGSALSTTKINYTKFVLAEKINASISA